MKGAITDPWVNTKRALTKTSAKTIGNNQNLLRTLTKSQNSFRKSNTVASEFHPQN